MEWVALLPCIFGLHVVLTEWAARAMKPPEEPGYEACEHPFYIDNRCIICGTPK